MNSRILTWICLCAASTYATAQQQAFQAQVRPTEALGPAEERAALRVPQGFEVTLFAAEPDILKPMNLAFDTRGRLWATVTQDYPYPSDAPSDALMILEDTDGDGAADAFTKFADGLSIPIGVYPTEDGAIVWSIPNILRLRDTDGDDVADVREVIYGPLGEPRDTHGMQNAFRRGADGWLYINHGFNNTSRLQGADGSAIELNSGNVYRVRIDGSRVETFTHGQVNPFGSDWDRFGNLYTADCHSRPIYQLIPQAYYPSFGKPHDGLGFGPEILRHSHGSTAISGLVLYQDDLWPQPFHDNAFIGNVMTSRINRDQIAFQDSSPVATEREDFLVSEDPWFRPVDLRMGPDGALYVADFYNRIIGHYEVPLDHPGRDRTRGRIWRIHYTGGAPVAPMDLDARGVVGAFDELASPNATRRDLALDWLESRASEETLGRARALLLDGEAQERQRIGALWLLHRRNRLDETTVVEAFDTARTELQVHLLHTLEARSSLAESSGNALVRGLDAGNPHVVRAAARTLARHPRSEATPSLVAAYEAAPERDTHLRHQVRIALRNLLRLPEALEPLMSDTGAQPTWLVEVIAAIPTETAAAFLIRRLTEKPAAHAENARYFAHAARYLAPESIPQLIALERLGSLSLEERLELIESAIEGWSRRGEMTPEALRSWGKEVIAQAMDSVLGRETNWSVGPAAGGVDSEIPWFLQPRSARGVEGQSPFLCSLPPGGERLTGVVHSPEFAAPPSLTLSIAGHRGFPDQPAHNRNRVQIVHTATGEILATAYPPRNDLATDAHFDLSDHEGQNVRIEAIDGDTGEAYAWLAIGRIRPPVVPLPHVGPRDRSGYARRLAALVAQLDAPEFLSELLALFHDADLELDARIAAARASVQLDPTVATEALTTRFSEEGASRALLGGIAEVLAQTSTPRSSAFLQSQLEGAESELQEAIALAMAQNRGTAETLLTTIESGKASPFLLQSPAILQRLSNHPLANRDNRITRLTDNLPPPADLGSVIEERIGLFEASQANLESGRSVFEAHCRACHRVGSDGGLIGPQLDDARSRGIARLTEDILDPNRNVDRAFRYALVFLKNGGTRAGLQRRQEGALTVFADLTGQEFAIPTDEITAIQSTPYSLMPTTFAEAISPEAFAHLLGFLTQQ